MAFFARRYMSALSTHPILTKSVTSGFLMGSGDAIAQYINHRESPEKQGERFKYNARRGTQMTVLGCVLVGPLFHKWFHVLDTIVKRPGLQGAVMKVAIDQAIMAPSFLTIFYLYMGTCEGYTLQETWEKQFKPHYIPSLTTNYTIWPAAQFINVYFVPMKLRVLWLNSIGLLFNIYLSHRSHSHDHHEDDGNDAKEVVVVEDAEKQKL